MNQVNLTRVSYNEFCPFIYCFLYLQPNNWVSLGSIGANSQDAASITYLIDGVGHGSAAERCDQTGHGGGMSEAGTVV
jgi:hypothetical protein